MSLPVVAGLAAWFLWQGLDPADRRTDHRRSFALGGALAGLSLYTYLAARVAYIPTYYLGLRPWRSLIWAVGFFATLLMLLAALV